MNNRTSAELRLILKDNATKMGSQGEWAKAHGLSASYVSELIRGTRDISDAVAERLGYRRAEEVWTPK